MSVLSPSRKMPAHDRVICVGFAKGLAAVLDFRAEKIGGKLVFHFLDARAVGVAKEKPDHPIVENPIDERINNRPQTALAAKLVKKAIAHNN